MANVAFTLPGIPRTFPFEIPSGSLQNDSAIPRARLTFQLKNQVITAKIATNTTSIVSSCVLPQNFVYTFEYCTCLIEVIDDVADAGNFDEQGSLEFGFNDLLGARTIEMVSSGIFGVGANAGSGKVWRPLNALPTPIFNTVGTAPNMTLSINDNDAGATNAALYSFIISVLQYDLTQVFAYPLNFPLPVSSR